jgi:hypothetical protein
MQFVILLQERLQQLGSSALSQTTDGSAASEATVPSVSTLRDYARLEALRVERAAFPYSSSNSVCCKGSDSHRTRCDCS